MQKAAFRGRDIQSVEGDRLLTVLGVLTLALSAGACILLWYS